MNWNSSYQPIGPPCIASNFSNSTVRQSRLYNVSQALHCVLKEPLIAEQKGNTEKLISLATRYPSKCVLRYLRSHAGSEVGCICLFITYKTNKSKTKTQTKTKDKYYASIATRYSLAYNYIFISRHVSENVGHPQVNTI
jgi:hypothetical protein